MTTNCENMATLDRFLSQDDLSVKVNQLLNLSEKNLLTSANEMWTNLNTLCQSLSVSIECYFNLFANMMKMNLSSLNYEKEILNVYDEWIAESREHLKEFCNKKDFKSSCFKERIMEINSNLYKKFENIENLFIVTSPAKSISLGEKESVKIEMESEKQFEQEETSSAAEWYDLGDIDLNSLDFELRKVLVNKYHVIPPENYQFPVTIQNNRERTERKVSHMILNKFKPWLVFSLKLKGLFCEYCAIVHNGQQSKNYQFKTHKLSYFIKEACCKFTNLTGSTGRLCRHEASIAHRYAVIHYNKILNEVQCKAGLPGVRKDAMCTINQSNTESLITIISLMKKMTKQNIEFRGNRDSGRLEMDTICSNKENWQEMLKFAATISKNFRDFVENSANATYISHFTMGTFQKILANLVQIQLINEIKDARFFSIMFDETSDVSGENILSFVLRYVFENEIKECFFGFYNTYHEGQEFMGNEPKITGEILGKIILKIFYQLNLSLENCVSIGSDGGAMCASREIDAIRYIKDNLSPGCTHSYCISHLINLCVFNVTNLSKVELVINMINKIRSFFELEKRQNVLMKHFPETDKRKLKPCSKTRLIERFEAVMVFKIKLKYIFKALIEVENWDDQLTSAKAFKYRSTIENFDFISTLVFICDIMKFLEPLAIKLQTVTIDIHSALSEVKRYSLGLKEKIGEHALTLFNSLIEEATHVYNELLLPDKYKNKHLDCDTKNYIEFYKSIIDKFIADLESHLNQREFVSSKISQLHPQLIHNIEESDIDEIMRMFHAQISSAGYEMTLFMIKQEIEHFKIYYASSNNNLTFINLSIITANQYTFLSALFKLIATITVANSTAEMSYYKLKLIKTVLRNSIIDKNLSNEAMISMNRETDISEERVLEEYSKENSIWAGSSSNQRSGRRSLTFKVS